MLILAKSTVLQTKPKGDKVEGGGGDGRDGGSGGGEMEKSTFEQQLKKNLKTLIIYKVI